MEEPVFYSELEHLFNRIYHYGVSMPQYSMVSIGGLIGNPYKTYKGSAAVEEAVLNMCKIYLDDNKKCVIESKCTQTKTN